MDAKAAEKAAGPSPERLDFEEQFQGPPGPLPLLNELDQLLAPSDLQVRRSPTVMSRKSRTTTQRSAQGVNEGVA